VAKGGGRRRGPAGGERAGRGRRSGDDDVHVTPVFERERVKGAGGSTRGDRTTGAWRSSGRRRLQRRRRRGGAGGRAVGVG
jgi:hypothetical protein